MEVGTFQGLGALAIKGSLPEGSEIITLDIVPWNEIKDSALRTSDFADGSLRQVIGDLGDGDQDGSNDEGGQNGDQGDAGLEGHTGLWFMNFARRIGVRYAISNEVFVTIPMSADYFSLIAAL